MQPTNVFFFGGGQSDGNNMEVIQWLGGNGLELSIFPFKLRHKVKQ